jgi:hypothetical protein
VNAFGTGYDSGAGGCAGLPARVVTTELPFRTVKEELTGGNLPYDVAAVLFTRSLDAFWAAALRAVKPGATFVPPVRVALAGPPLPPCPQPDAYDRRDAIGYCPPADEVAWLDPAMRAVNDTLGDYAAATLFSEEWGRAAQTQAGLPVAGKPAGLQRDCFTGAWVSAIASSGAAQFLLSPGDLDKVLATILASSFGPRGDPTHRGSAFERTEALRRGVLRGLTACR